MCAFGLDVNTRDYFSATLMILEVATGIKIVFVSKGTQFVLSSKDAVVVISVQIFLFGGNV